MKMPIKGRISVKAHPRDPSCKGSINKKTGLFSYKFYCRGDAVAQIRSLCEICSSVYTEMGVVCCDLAHLVLWADREPQSKSVLTILMKRFVWADVCLPARSFLSQTQNDILMFDLHGKRRWMLRKQFQQTLWSKLFSFQFSGLL